MTTTFSNIFNTSDGEPQSPCFHTVLSPDRTERLREDYSSIVRNNLQVDRIGYMSDSEAYTRFAYQLENVLSNLECKELVRKSENFKYASMKIGENNGTVTTEVDAIILDDVKFAQEIFRRCKRYLPQIYQDPFSREKYKLLEIDEQLRFIRLTEGKGLKSHIDGAYERPDGCRSWISLIVYLNDGYRGGRTRFVKWGTQNPTGHQNCRITVPLKAGSVLVHDHNLLHETTPVNTGTRYTLCMDVLYSRIEVDDHDNNYCCIIL